MNSPASTIHSQRLSKMSESPQVCDPLEFLDKVYTFMTEILTLDERLHSTAQPLRNLSPDLFTAYTTKWECVNDRVSKRIARALELVAIGEVVAMSFDEKAPEQGSTEEDVFCVTHVLAMLEFNLHDIEWDCDRWNTEWVCNEVDDGA